MTQGLGRGLTQTLAAVYAALGTLELVMKIAEESAVATIAFFGGTLIGGAALILGGLCAHVTSTTRRALVILGAGAGLVASAWTIFVPVLAITVIVANAHPPAVPRAEAHQP